MKDNYNIDQLCFDRVSVRKKQTYSEDKHKPRLKLSI